jgi:6-phosphogluconolactonase (cycloisomerase 2 family)
MRTRKTQRGRGILLACLAACAMTVWASPALADNAKNAVYVQSNTSPFNSVLVFDRNPDGTLTPAGSVLTGGEGKPAGNPPLGIPFLDTAGSVTLSNNGKNLFVVNAGDNTVSSFRVGSSGLQLADVEPSFGSRPASSATNGKLLYVMNSDTGSASISGYRIGSQGELTPIPGSVRPTSDPANGLPAQIVFDNTGKVLTVSERFAGGGNGLLDTFLIGPDGTPGPVATHPSDETPYGMAYTHRNNILTVTNEHASDPFQSTASTFNVTRHGEVTHIDTDPTNAGAACWNQITNDDKYLLITSPFSFAINSFRIETNGSLTPVNGTSIVYTSDGLTLDESLSHESKYLYVLVSDFFASSKLQEFRVNSDGTVTFIGETPPFDGSASGAAAW